MDAPTTKALFQIRGKKLEIATDICEHPVQTWEQYLLVVGTYKGLAEAEEIISEAHNERGDDESGSGETRSDS